MARTCPQWTALSPYRNAGTFEAANKDGLSPNSIQFCALDLVLEGNQFHNSFLPANVQQHSIALQGVFMRTLAQYAFSPDKNMSASEAIRREIFRASPGNKGWTRAQDQAVLKRLQFPKDRGNQLRDRRMNVHGPFQHRVGGTRIHYVQDAVDRLIPACPENGCSQDLF